MVTRHVPQIALALGIAWLLTPSPYASVDRRGMPLPDGIVLSSSERDLWFGYRDVGEGYAQIVNPGTADERLVLTGRYGSLVFEVVSRTDVTLLDPASLDATPESVGFTAPSATVETWRVANPKLIVRHVGKVGEFVDAEIWFEMTEWGWFSHVAGSVHVRRLADRASP